MDINPQTSIEELIEKCPKSLDVFKKYNIRVLVCGEPVWDTISEVCEKSNQDVNLVLSDIKKVC
jgi:iron-sulfur cluster repair protein YtfE (RIC family)